MPAFAPTSVVAPPFRPRTNPHLPTLAAQSIQWAQRFALTANASIAARLGQANAAELAARAAPGAELTHAQLLSDLITWLFALDDVCDEDGGGADPCRISPLISPLMQVLERYGVPAAGSATDQEPLAAALADLCHRVRRLRRPGALLRFTASLHHYLFALLWEASNRQQGRVPAVAEYIQMRRHTGAVLPSFALTDLAENGLPHSRHRVDPRLAELNTVAADLVCWCNDLFSYAKEHHQDPHNLAVVIAHETGRGAAAGLAEASTRFTDSLALYLRLEAEVLIDAPPAVERLVAARRHWIRGTYDWSVNSHRYR
ncbi:MULTISPECIES: bifunctional terpene synthase/polyprenyl synthetase family protein [unclassified Solwaraspora]|uniref:bifunctional terpene synthase/polyprenyl synthetase family protein n=1 Tax=unclassified Solwaraspora TaxID=2627926 RepID=UPI00259BE9A7|nr:bifunctional terpene synthase/polyprenyl synthetase family protein [Solwaraspora sp. WMMA2056]WJK38107.1 bifunctional terpene synthase/polyprenyl synthetase family protein [Solwaraspora sp. WMMA2056]